MLPLLALLVLAGPLSTQDSSSLSPKEERRVEKLEAAIAANRPGEIVRTLKSTARIDDERVLQAVLGGLNSPILGVQSASLEALRFQPNAAALENLHKVFARKKLLRENPEFLAQLLRATGQRADASSLQVLSAGGFRQDTDEILRARIFALGNLPGKEAVDALVLGMNTTEPRQRLLHMDEFRVALVKQTGADWGMDPEAWTNWWNENRADADLPGAEDPLPGYLNPVWNSYWEATSVLPLVLPEAPKPTPETNQPPKKARGPQASGGQPVEANAKRQAKGSAGKSAGGKTPYRRPGMEDQPPRGKQAPAGQAPKRQGAGKQGAGKQAAGKQGPKGKAEGQGKPAPQEASNDAAEKEAEATPQANPAEEAPKRTQGIRVPKWDSTEME